MKKAAILILTCISLSSCNVFSTGHLTRRYKSINEKDIKADINQYVSIDGYSILADKAEPTKRKTVLDLSPKGQAALIVALNGRADTINKFPANLASFEFGKDASALTVLDYTQFSKRVVISIRNLSYAPGDRISKVKIDVDIDSTVKLLSCNRLSTEFMTLDLGKLNYSSTSSANLSGNASSTSEFGAAYSDSVNSKSLTGSRGANMGIGVNGSLSASNTFSEEVNLKQRIVALNATINDNVLSLYQESLSGVDLTGNIIADISFKVQDVSIEKTYSFSNLMVATKYVDASNLKISEKIVIYPAIEDDIIARISFSAGYRKIKNGDKTISEADDRILLEHGYKENQDSFVVITKDELIPKMYSLSVKGDASHLPVEIYSGSGRGTLIFNSYNEAKDFLLWLQSKYVANPSKEMSGLGANGYVLSMPKAFTNVQSLEILPY